MYTPGDAKTPTLLAATSAFLFVDVLWRDTWGSHGLRRKGERDDADRVDEAGPSMARNDGAAQATPNATG